MRVVVSAITLTEVVRGRPEDAQIHRVLKELVQLPVSTEFARQAGVLLSQAGLNGPIHAIDAVVAATALQQQRSVIILTSDPVDLHRLTDESGGKTSDGVTIFTV